jgi:ABC-type lipoprotein export system ATPase subunit
LIELARERGKTVIVASHDPKVVEAFPRIYQMRDGVIGTA